MIPCSSRVKCHAWDVPCMFHGILHVKVHQCSHATGNVVHANTRRELIEYLCRVSLRVHACKSEVINERYCIIFYKGLYNLITLEMPSYITSTTTTPYSTRFQHPFHFNIPNARTNFYHNSYFPKTVRDWNSLPISAIEAHTVNSFCNQLLLFLIVNNYCNVL